MIQLKLKQGDYITWNSESTLPWLLFKKKTIYIYTRYADHSHFGISTCYVT